MVVAASAAGTTMSVLRQGRHYLLIGILQWLLDWAVMVGLSHLGLGIPLANVIGRISGALLGYWLNGRVTFAGDEHHMGRKQFARFLLMWMCFTLLSTVALQNIDLYVGRGWAWLSKPLVELVLGACGFLLSRHWIYRR